MIDMIIGIIIGMLAWQLFILLVYLFSDHDDYVTILLGIGFWQLVCFAFSIPSYFVKKWRGKRR